MIRAAQEAAATYIEAPASIVFETSEAQVPGMLANDPGNVRARYHTFGSAIGIRTDS